MSADLSFADVSGSTEGPIMDHIILHGGHCGECRKGVGETW